MASQVFKLKKLVNVNISVPVRQMYHLEKSEQLFFSVGSYSLLDFSDWRLAEEREVVALKRISDGLSLLGHHSSHIVCLILVMSNRTG